MWSINKLKLYIERKRIVMIESANSYGFNSEITIKHSQELDELLNQYRKIVEQQKKHLPNYQL